MADLQSDKTEDTSVSEAVSTKEELETDDTSLEDMEIAFEDEDDETESEEAKESEDSATEDDSDTLEEDTNEESTESTTEDEAEDESTDNEQSMTDAERKRYNDEMAKARIAERDARREAEAVKRKAEEDNLNRYLEEAQDDEDELAKRQLEVETYRLNKEKVNFNQDRLYSDLELAYSTVDLFQTGSPAVKNRLLKAVDQFEAMNVVKDDKGQPIRVKGSLLQHIKQEADSIRQEQEELRAELLGKQQSSKQGQKSRTLTAPSRSPKQPKVDSDIADFDAAVKNGW